MQIGDLVRARWFAIDPGLGVVVGESVMENAKEINRMYKVLWQDGSSFLAERKCLQAVRGGNNGNAK